MERRTREKDDRISELPVFLLHRILSYLPRKDAAITSVLSKRWNSVWHSFPILKFSVTDYIKERHGTPEFAEKFEKFLKLVDKSLQNFTQNKLRIEVFYLNMSLSDDKYIPMVNTWIPLALHNGASRISFWVGPASGDDYPFPETTFDVKSICGSSRFYRLQKLDLTMVYVSENMVRDIIRNCPNISDLCLSFFHGLKSLEISKLEKLKKLSIGVAPDVREIECLSVDGPLLENLEFVSFEPKLPCVIKLISCHALKSLRLTTCAITDDLLSSYMSTSPLLEHLHVNDCHMLRRIRIFGQRLKSLELHKCNELEVVQIHAPNLSRFKFISHKNMPILFPENVIPCSVHVHYHIRSTNGPIDSFWFLKMREFLGVSARGVRFSLLVLDNEVISFHPEALRDVAIPQLVNVDLLEISSSRILSEFDCDTLLDGLLWCCHPKEISLRLDSVFQSNCIKVLCKKLVGMEQPLCCQLSQIKCWRHSFKSVKIDNLEATKDDRLLHPNYFLNSLSSFDEEGQEVRFVLDWDL